MRIFKYLRIILLTGFIFFSIPTVTRAATFTVDTVDDTSDSVAGNGICRDAGGNCSVRAAIEETNALHGANTVNVPSETYLLNSALHIQSNLTLVGSSANDTVLDGQSASQIIRINSAVTVYLQDITLAHGSGGLGGAVTINGSDAFVTMTRVWVNNSSALGGGGIFMEGGQLNLDYVRIYHNNATSGKGGGISCDDGNITINHSIIYTNSVTGSGGAIGSYCDINMTNTTIYDNTATTDGGGVWDVGSLNLVNSTFMSNYADNLSNGVYLSGNFTSKNTIFYNPDGGGNNCVNDDNGSVLSLGGNVLSDNSCSSVFNESTDLLRTDPLLSTPSNNGGEVETAAIGSSSPAFNAGVASGCPSTDARGITRPVGGYCDSGAYEFVYTPTPTPRLAEAKAPACSKEAPRGTPNLFQIDSAGTYVNMYFTTAKDNTTQYHIFYGTNSDANEFAETFDYSGDLWVIGHAINNLSPNSDYYFKVRAVNSCNAGQFSQTMHVTTKGRLANISRFFANLVSSSPVPKISAPLATEVTSCDYTISSGDTLWKIANAKWGSGMNYKKILTFNTSLTEESLLQIGKEIKLCE